MHPQQTPPLVHDEQRRNLRPQQGGRIHIYLLYSFVTLLVLLIFVR